MKRSILVVLVVLAGGPARGQAAFADPVAAAEPTLRSRLAVRAVPSHLEVAPGQTFHVALDMRIADGWWYYSRDPGDNGKVQVLPATIEANAAPLRAGSVLWPPQRRHEYRLDNDRLVNNVYEGRAIAFVVVQVPADAKPGRRPIVFRMGGQVCDPDHCLGLDFPEPYSVAAEVTVGSQPRANPEWDSALAAALVQARPAPGAGSTLSLWAGLGLALLAGVILNVMPCVLPVIPLKVLSLVEHARQSRIRMITHGLAFAGGIMVFFVVLACASAAVRLASRGGVEWGAQFQSEGLRLTVAMIVVAVAANLFGLYSVSLPGFRSRAVAGGAGGHLSSAGSGVLTAVLSTPCSFGYLTGALAWAQLQPVWLGSATILVIGLGMAAPYAVLTGFPGLLRRLPRPGRWMELLKQSMGFVLLLVAVWLVGTLGGEGTDYPLWAAAFGIVLAFGLWMWGTWVRYDAPLRRKLIVRGLAVAIVAAAGYGMLAPPRPLAVRFVEFDRAQIDEARQAGRIVLVDFTARWCLTCKTVEYRVYDDREVADRLRDANVLAVRGDITRSGLPAGRMLFGELQEPGVPVSVVFPPDGREPIRLHGVFSKSDLFRALKQAGANP